MNAAREAEPFNVVTTTLPDAPDARMALILVEELTANDRAATPPNVTAVAPVRPVPVMFT